MWEFQLGSIEDLKQLSERLGVQIEAIEARSKLDAIKNAFPPPSRCVPCAFSPLAKDETPALFYVSSRGLLC